MGAGMFVPFVADTGRDGIESPGMPWMTAQQTGQRQPAALDRAMHCNGFKSVV